MRVRVECTEEQWRAMPASRPDPTVAHCIRCMRKGWSRGCIARLKCRVCGLRLCNWCALIDFKTHEEESHHGSQAQNRDTKVPRK